MIYVYYVLGVLALLIGIVVGLGALEPVKHVAKRVVDLNSPKDKVWALITNYADMPTWRRELRKIEMVTGANGQEIWQEFENASESLDFETIEQIEGQKLVRKIVGNRTDFGGTWTFELEENGDQTTLTITENGEVYNIVFRFVSKYIMGHYASIDKFIRQLNAAL